MLEGGHGCYEVEHRPWIDHVYRLRWNGRTVYVSEPYHLQTRDMYDLLALERIGWEVQIDGHGSHAPSTIRICLLRPGEGTEYEVPPCGAT